MKAEGIPFSLDICGKCEIYEKKIARILICVLIIICGWNVMVRENGTRQEKRIRNIKKNNANARAQSANSQDVSLEDDLQETETSLQHSGSNNRSENENITGNSGNSSGKMKETMKKRMPMTA